MVNVRKGLTQPDFWPGENIDHVEKKALNNRVLQVGHKRIKRMLPTYVDPNLKKYILVHVAVISEESINRLFRRSDTRCSSQMDKWILWPWFLLSRGAIFWTFCDENFFDSGFLGVGRQVSSGEERLWFRTVSSE